MISITRSITPSIFAIAICIFFRVPVCMPVPSQTFTGFNLLSRYISAYNLDHLKKSLSDQTYRGEEGILGLTPETAQSFGLRVYTNQDYLKARQLYTKAEDLMQKITDVLGMRAKKKPSGECVRKIAVMAVQHNRAAALGWKRLMSYRTRLKSETDDRLDDTICSRLLEKLLEKELAYASNNLRDALGNLFNRCRSLDTNEALNTENITFVNYVFKHFIETAPADVLSRFDLDRHRCENSVNDRPDWKMALEASGSRFAPILESAFERYRDSSFRVDELLFLALIRQESAYDPRNVSHVGAAGLTQIMPQTAISLGMKNIFLPPYFREAGSLLTRERILKRQARDLVLEITEKNSLRLAQQAKNLFLESLSCGDQRKKLYTRYRRELLNGKQDDRLDPGMAIIYGLKYFSQMMKIQKGDISLALASYNAGPHRIRTYNGIPPFKETIDFRNKVLRYYRMYQGRVIRRLSKQLPDR